MDESLVTVSAERVAQIAKVSPRRLRYWDETGLVTPSTKRQVSARNTVRLYSFQEAVEVSAVAQLLRSRMSLQHVRRVVAYLRTRGYERPLRQLTYVVLGKEIYFQHPDGTWEGDLSPRQTVVEQVLHVERLRGIVERGLQRQSDEVGQVERRRGRLGNKPVFAGTRLPVETVVRYLRRGYGTEHILGAYPVLTEADIDRARRELRSA